jgi:tetratricopeptide (TPR) repeat protein
MSQLSRLQDELALARREKDPRSERIVLRQMGELYAQNGDWKRWLACEEQALPLARQAGSPQDVVEILCNLGAAYTDANQPQRAADHLQEALRLARANSLRIHEAAILGNLARAQTLTDLSQSLKTYDEALVAAHRSGPREALALLPGALWAAKRAEQYERAIVYAKQGVLAARKAQDRAAEGRFLLELGLLLIGQQALDDATRCLRAARPLLHVTASTQDLLRCDEALARLPGPPSLPDTTPTLPRVADEELASPSQRLARNPRDVLALVGRAEAYLAAGKPRQAHEDLLQAEKILQTEPRLLQTGRLRENLLLRVQNLKMRVASPPAPSA